MVDAEPLALTPKLYTYDRDRAEISFEPEDGEARVYRVDLNAGAEGDAFAELSEWEWLSLEERGRAQRLVRPRDGRRFVRCRGALRVILGSLLGSPPEAVEFRAGPGGKPVLPLSLGSNGRPPLHFNVSHSGELALIAVSRRCEVGVDVEQARPISQAERIVQSYFTETELAQFESIGESARIAAFIRGWTRKEAILKAKGVGLAGLATSFETMFGTDDPGDEFARCTPLSTVMGWALWEVSPQPGYMAALAVEEG